MASSLRCVFSRLNAAKLARRSYSSERSEKRGVVLGAYYDEENCNLQLTKTAEKFDKLTEGKLKKYIEIAGNKVKQGKSLLFWGLEENFTSVVVVGLGNQNQSAYDEHEHICPKKEAVRVAASAGCRMLQSVGVNDICLESLGDAEAAAEGSILGTWKFQEYKSNKEDLPTIKFLSNEHCSTDEKDLWDVGVVKAKAQNLARHYADTPANLLTPTVFAECARKTLECLDVKVEVRDEVWAKSQDMHAFLAVGKGSCEPSKFLEMSYRKGCKDDNPIVLVGKGVTFDSGGISLKPPNGMDQMRADMSGAACVLGAIYAIASLKTQVNIIALIPLVENMPSGSALKPGDLVYASNGKSILVDNTDAEGRLILADALCYSEKFKPKWVLDIATLTGVMKSFMGCSATGVFTNSGKLYDHLQSAASVSGDRVWRFPIWKHFRKQVTDFPSCDVNNISKARVGGSCTAAAFLKEFVPENTDWLHLDIAGVMGPDDETPYLHKGMTGRPTRTLIEFIEKNSKIIE